MAGRPRKPTALHLVEGTYKPSQSNKEEPKTPALKKLPPPPKGFTPEQAEAWMMLARGAVKLGVLTDEDLPALKALARTHAQLEALWDVINTKGLTYETESGQSGRIMIRPRPEAQMIRQVTQEYLNLLGRFGMTPSDRAKVKTLPGALPPAAGDADPDEEFGA